MIPPTSIDGTDITGATIDGTDVQEITVDGDVVFSAAPQDPAAGLLHQWDWSAANSTTSFVEDQAGSADATGTFDSFDTINGIQAGYWPNPGGFTANIPDFTDNRIIAAVFQTDLPSSQHSIYGDDAMVLRINNSNYFLFQGSALNGGTADTNPHISVVQLDATDILRIDGTQVISGNAGTANIDDITFGAQANLDNHLEGRIGEILIYELSSAPSFATIENYLASKWGITI